MKGVAKPSIKTTEQASDLVLIEADRLTRTFELTLSPVDWALALKPRALLSLSSGATYLINKATKVAATGVPGRVRVRLYVTLIT